MAEILKIAQYVVAAAGPHETVQVLLSGHPGAHHAALRASLHEVRLEAVSCLYPRVARVAGSCP